jgi:hypothetical protein
MLDAGNSRFKYYVDGIAEANERRISLAIVRPRQMQICWTRPGSTRQLPIDQMELDLYEAMAIEDRQAVAAKVPRLEFTDGTGDHLLQLRDWGAFELIRRYGVDYAMQHMEKSLHIDTGSALLVGNVLRHQNAWLVISVLNGISSDQLSLDISA